MITTVWIKTTFVAWHRWKDAPEEFAYLRDFHRHLFHVTAELIVKKLDREVEFISLKHSIDDWLRDRWHGKRLELSCEQMAHKILKQFHLNTISVSEDGENGARVVNVRKETLKHMEEM